MRKILALATLALITLGNPISSSAQTVDSEGYPVMYLRGDFNNTGWAALEQYRFQRDGDTYTLALPSLSGRFKVSNDDWTYNFGAQPNTPPLDSSCVLRGIANGANISGNFTENVEISFKYAVGYTDLIFTVNGVRPPEDPGISGTLPVLHINVFEESGAYDNEILSRDLAHKNYFSGEYWLDMNGCTWLEEIGGENIGSSEEPLPLEIKARGNWTRIGFSKKPFKLKLGKKQSLLGMSKSKHYAILAHADDNASYLKNFTGFNLGKRIGLPWTPTQQPVEVIINGDYRGLYFLTESIRVGDGRVMIEELADNETDPSLVSGGYLVELDNYNEDNQIRMEEQSFVGGYTDMLRITFDTPEIYSDIQRQFVTDQFSAMNNLVGTGSDDLWSYLDLDDAARYYLVEEIISHVEAYHGSTYLYRDRGDNQKWHFSPLWDCGNAYNGPTDDYFYRHAPFGTTWIASMKANGRFLEKVKETWLWFMSNRYAGLDEEIDTYCEAIAEAAKADRRRWKDEPAPAVGQPVCDNSDITRGRDRVKQHLAAKTEWLKSKFGDYSTGIFPESERDDTPAAPLPDYLTSGIDMLDSVSYEVRYFNLQGLPIENPKKGEIVIFVENGLARKTIIR